MDLLRHAIDIRPLRPDFFAAKDDLVLNFPEPKALQKPFEGRYCGDWDSLHPVGTRGLCRALQLSRRLKPVVLNHSGVRIINVRWKGVNPVRYTQYPLARNTPPWAT